MTDDRDSISNMLDEWASERPDLNPKPVGIHARIIRLSSHLLRRTEIWLAPLDLSWEAFSLIVTLRRTGKPFERRPTDLLRESLLSSGAITNRIDRVERMGLIERKEGGDDRRSYTIRLTAAGKRLADKAIEAHFEGVRRGMSALTAAEQKQLSSLLQKLLLAMESQSPPRDPPGGQ